MLHCLDAVTGELVWKVDTFKEFNVVQNFFGVGSTPLVEGDLLICVIGGASEDTPPDIGIYLDRVKPNGTGVVAFDKKTGKVKYKLGDELAGYASPVCATLGGKRWCFAFCRGGLLGFDPATGKEEFHFPWRAKTLECVNASNPVVVEDKVFISECYGVGGALLQVEPGGCEALWTDDEKPVREQSLLTHWNTAVYHEGYLYGSSGRHTPDAELRCVDFESGEVKWSVPELSRSSLLLADGHFICLTEYGELILFKANPEKFEQVARVYPRRSGGKPIPGFGAPPLLRYPCWAAPVLSHGLLYVRGDDRLVCMELIPEKE
jgi:outer membrane protein assembly factor BamB